MKNYYYYYYYKLREGKKYKNGQKINKFYFYLILYDFGNARIFRLRDEVGGSCSYFFRCNSLKCFKRSTSI